MRYQRAAIVLLMTLVTMSIIEMNTASAQTDSKPLYTDYEPLLCVGGGFVAMAGITRNAPLIVIQISPNGIEVPRTLQTGANDVLGMMCSEHQIELLVIDQQTGRLIVPLYTMRWHPDGSTTIEAEQPEEIKLPKTGPTPPALNFRQGSLEWQGRQWGHGATGISG